MLEVVFNSLKPRLSRYFISYLTKREDELGGLDQISRGYRLRILSPLKPIETIFILFRLSYISDVTFTRNLCHGGKSSIPENKNSNSKNKKNIEKYRLSNFDFLEEF